MQETVQKTTTVVTPPPSYQKVKTTKVEVEPSVKTEHPQKVYETKKVIFRTYQVVWYITGVVEILLTFRLILKLLAANPASSFTAFIYAVSDPFALPFAGIFGVTVTPTNGVVVSVVEWSTFVAMVVYALLAWGIIQLFQLIKPTTPEEVEQTIDTK